MTNSSRVPELLLLLDRWEMNVKKNPGKMAVTFLEPALEGGKIQRSLSYQALWDETTAVATLLLENGMKKGDRAVLVYPPSLDFMIAFLACLKISVVAVPVFPPNPNRRATIQMFARIVECCEPQLALTNREYNHLKKLSGIRDKFQSRGADHWPENLKWFVTEEARNNNNNKLDTFHPTTRVEWNDLAFLQYTSGSTSEPKGVMVTHYNLAHNLTIITNDLAASQDTVVVSWLPQYHDMGLIGSYLGVLYCGGSGYYMSPLSFLQRPMLWIEAASKYKATHLQAPNFAFKLTARKFQSSAYTSKTLDLASIQHIINAAEPVDETTIDCFYQQFKPFGLGTVIFPTYGLAEHTVFVCSGGTQRISVDKQELETNGRVVIFSDGDRKDAEDSKILLSRLVGCGYPERQGVVVRIVDYETLLQLEDGKVGEIWINSPSKAAGYYNKPEETKRDFHGLLLQGSSEDTEEGYLRTGDLGFMHGNELFICGRVKDLIIVGGRNYYPQDIEATAEAAATDLVRPGCSAAFTIDPTKSGGEEVALVMELKDVPSTKEIPNVCIPLATDIKSSINQEHSLGISVIVFLKPRTVPKTSSGKIARSLCRKGFIGGTLSVVFQKAFVTDQVVFEIEPKEGDQQLPTPNTTTVDPQTIRSISKQQLLSMLIKNVAEIGSMPPDSVDKDAPLNTTLSSLDLAQFKGLLEARYACKLSDDYLFRDTTTLSKLADVAKLGYAPDDGDIHAGSSTYRSQPDVGGKAKGLAGALGCPPGVRCVIM